MVEVRGVEPLSYIYSLVSLTVMPGVSISLVRPMGAAGGYGDLLHENHRGGTIRSYSGQVSFTSTGSVLFLLQGRGGPFRLRLGSEGNTAGGSATAESDDVIVAVCLFSQDD